MKRMLVFALVFWYLPPWVLVPLALADSAGYRGPLERGRVPESFLELISTPDCNGECVSLMEHQLTATDGAGWARLAFGFQQGDRGGAPSITLQWREFETRPQGYTHTRRIGQAVAGSALRVRTTIARDGVTYSLRWRDATTGAIVTREAKASMGWPGTKRLLVRGRTTAGRPQGFWGVVDVSAPPAQWTAFEAGLVVSGVPQAFHVRAEGADDGEEDEDDEPVCCDIVDGTEDTPGSGGGGGGTLPW